MHRFVLISLVLVSLPAAADLADDVRCREIGFAKAVEAQDRDSFASFIDPDARFVNESVLKARDAITNAWDVFFGEDAPDLRWRPQFVEVLESGDLALTRGPYRLIDADENGDPREGWGTFNSVWRLNDDGEWLVVFDAGSFPDENPTDEQRALLDAGDDCD